MSWWKKLLGIKSPVEKKLAEIDRLQSLHSMRKGKEICPYLANTSWKWTLCTMK